MTGPALRPVRRRDLAVLALGLALATWLVVRVSYGALPPLRWWLPVPLAVLALAEVLGARALRARLTAERRARTAARKGRAQAARPGAPSPQDVRPVEPLVVARLAVLAQASAYVGAVCVGLWAGVLLHVGPAAGRLQAAGGDALTAVLGMACAAALVVAALVLEAVCRVPPPGEDDNPDAPARA